MLMTALILYLSTLFGGSSAAAIGPVLAELEDARDRVGLVAQTRHERRAIVERIDAVLEASRSRDGEVRSRVSAVQRVFARHDARAEELRAALDHVRESLNAELNATMEAYYELRASLTREQWATLFPTPTSTEKTEGGDSPS